MNSQGPDEGRAKGSQMDIIGLRPAVIGLFVTFHCGECGHAFEGYQPTIAGVPLGQHACPQCGLTISVGPEEIEEALRRHLPSQSYEEMQELTAEAGHLTENWYRHTALLPALTYEGVNLGEPAERGLASFFTLGLYGSLLPQERKS